MCVCRVCVCYEWLIVLVCVLFDRVWLCVVVCVVASVVCVCAYVRV